MKKTMRLFGIMMVAAVMFTACSKKVNVDSSKWIDNLADGKAAAQNENKKIILFFSADDNDEVSTSLKAKVFNTDAFLSTITPNYVLVNLDFSKSLFDKTKTDDTSSKDDVKAAAELEKKLKANMRDATFYNVQGSPTVIILTKEGYVVTPIVVEDTLDSVESFTNLIEEKKADIEKFDTMLAATDAGTKEEQIKAIDALYEATDPQMRYLLSDLSEKLINLDKKNTSGFCGKHIIACANVEAMKAYIDGDSDAASKAFAKAAKNKLLSDDEKQQSFYTAGYLLGQSGSNDFKAMKKYFQSAYDVKPDSEHADQIKQMISIVENMEAQEAEQAKAKDAAPAAESEAVGPEEKPADSAEPTTAPAPESSAPAVEPAKE